MDNFVFIIHKSLYQPLPRRLPNASQLLPRQKVFLLPMPHPLYPYTLIFFARARHMGHFTVSCLNPWKYTLRSFGILS